MTGRSSSGRGRTRSVGGQGRAQVVQRGVEAAAQSGRRGPRPQRDPDLVPGRVPAIEQEAQQFTGLRITEICGGDRGVVDEHPATAERGDGDQRRRTRLDDLDPLRRAAGCGTCSACGTGAAGGRPAARRRCGRWRPGGRAARRPDVAGPPRARRCAPRWQGAGGVRPATPAPRSPPAPPRRAEEPRRALRMPGPASTAANASSTLAVRQRSPSAQCSRRLSRSNAPAGSTSPRSSARTPSRFSAHATPSR